MSGRDDNGDWGVRIYEDRYGGTYADGAWVAVDIALRDRDISEIENGILGDDVAAMKFWADVRSASWIAVGRTPDDALAALGAKRPKSN